MGNLKGFRTLIVNAVIVAATAVLEYGAGVKWEEYLSPTMAIMLLALINGGLRAITTTKIGEKE